MKVVVVMPTYNEAENLPAIVSAVLDLSVDGMNVLVVDDNSPDGTGEMAESLATRYDGRVHVLHRPEKQGLGPAYVQGFRKAIALGADYVVEMDADFSHKPDYIPQFLAAIKEYDVVVGSRYVPGGGVDANWSVVRKFVSWWGSVYSRLVLGLQVHDATGGFKCFRASALAGLDLEKMRSQGYAFQIEINYACQKKGYRIAEIPIQFPDRTRGKSKMSAKIALEAAWRVWEIKWRY
ncbi:MAG: polyprenol monophosphomannose synthase [Chloroflexi bacterium]|nr:polyprenol monophosphomannose synthase [Chloroflexota bacterium]